MKQNKLPSGWSWVKLGDIIGENGIFVDGDWVESKDQDPNGEVRLIQLADIGEISFRNKSNRFLSYTKAVELSCSFLSKDDLLIARMPDPLGRACLFPFDKKNKFVTVVDVAIVRVDSEIVNPKFLCYIVNAPQSRSNISALQSGSTRKRISRKNLATINYPLPPLKEQQKIVEKIEELFSELDNGVANLKKAREQIKVYKQSVLKYAFEGNLVQDKMQNGKGKGENGGLPEGWEWRQLEELGTIQRGKSKHRPRNDEILYGGKYPFIQTGDIRNSQSKYLNDYSQTYSERGLEQSKLWPKGTLCITIAANIADTAILGFDSCFPDSVVGFVPNEVTSSHFIYYFFKSQKNNLEKLAPATAQKNINVSILNKINVALPPKYLQTKIVEEIERRFSVADKMEAAIVESLKKAEGMRQSILKQAFEGKLV